MAMEKKYFIVNTGSASKKYALFGGDLSEFSAHFEHEDGGGIIVTFNKGEKSEKRKISESEYADATEYTASEMANRGLIKSVAGISAVGLRVVAPGSYFLTNHVVDTEYRKKLEETKEWAPLHTAPIISEINNLEAAFPGIPIVAVSDSAYHAAMPDHSRYYGLPLDDAERLDVFRFGYHGISFKSILPRLGSLSRVAWGKAIVCHLGSGSSIMAFKNGKSFDTSMGFSPLEGLPMSTRVGDIDAAAVIYLEKKLGLSPEEMEKYFNSQCGLLGLSGKTDDIRELLNLEVGGDERAKLALEIFSYKIKKYIGSYFAALNGADILIFSGTIGERSSIMRSRICRDMEALGIVIDNERNNSTISADGFIHHETNSPVKIAVIITDEMGQMASEVTAVLNK
ncbi:MAG: acetate/propionate family kinase [Candidatus Azambacteria bacterium]|nr:acetate/propionate family kinase [Candidatus Azambacteria bacterium]